jgi:hypothetical protein
MAATSDENGESRRRELIESKQAALRFGALKTGYTKFAGRYHQDVRASRFGNSRVDQSSALRGSNKLFGAAESKLDYEGAACQR